MSYESGIRDASFIAGEDLSSDQYKFMALQSDYTVKKPISETDVIIGVLQMPDVAGGAVTVRSHGATKLQMSEALAINSLVAPVVTGADAGQGRNGALCWKQACAFLMKEAGAEDALPVALVLGPQVQGSGSLIGQTTVSTISTAGAATYTAAQLLGGLILRDCAGASRTDVSPTAAAIIAAMPQGGIGNSFEFTVRNTSDDAETITLSGGADVTVSGTATIAQSNTKRFLAVMTGAATVTIYSLGTLVY